MNRFQLDDYISDLLAAQYLPLNPFSRPGKLLKDEQVLVLHWPGNLQRANQVNKYFADLSGQDATDKKPDRYASTQLCMDDLGILVNMPVRGLLGSEVTEKAYGQGGFVSEDSPFYYEDGKIYKPECVERYNPLHNLAWSLNNYALSIEVSVIDYDTGEMAFSTMSHLKHFAAWWCLSRNKDPFTAITLHGLCVEKLCPKYFMLNPEEFKNFLLSVKELMVSVQQED